MLDIGLSELLVVLAVALIVLGPQKLPEVAKSLGRGLAEFRRASDDLRRSILLESEPLEGEEPGEALPRSSPQATQEPVAEVGAQQSATVGSSEAPPPSPEPDTSGKNRDPG